MVEMLSGICFNFSLWYDITQNKHFENLCSNRSQTNDLNYFFRFLSPEIPLIDFMDYYVCVYMYFCVCLYLSNPFIRKHEIMLYSKWYPRRITYETLARFYLSNQARRLLAAPIRSTTEVRKSFGNFRLVLPS